MQKPDMPPEETTAKGALRRVGVEVEFAGLNAEEAAQIVAEQFGGKLAQADLYHWKVEGADGGDFSVKLDTRFVEEGGSDLQRYIEETDKDFGRELRKVVGRLAETVVPTEIVSPPLAISDIGRMDSLCKQLREAGATDGSNNPLFAFGLHLNPEVARADVDFLLPVLQAYLFLSPWLREEIGIDFSRRILPYIDPFPAAYRKLVLDDAYKPTLDGLISDYLEHNLTRNRELDMLPLFADINEGRVREAIDDPRVKPRPTFHYRLPEARIGDDSWSVTAEWQRWVAVEHLAANREALGRMLSMKERPQTPEDISIFMEEISGARLQGAS